MHAYVTSDFSVINVVENSHTDKPLLYQITGVWGNHEGSMVLWVFMLGAVRRRGGAVLRQPAARTARARAGGAGHDRHRLPAVHPAHLEPVPARLAAGRRTGRGSIRCCRTPASPSIRRSSISAMSASRSRFSFAVAALIEGRVDAAWARWVRPWTLAAWCALTIGIAMGSWWAYYTLGWGGWWFWDPVENASFMPWLVGTALIHSSIVVEKRDTLKSWTILLAIITFSLSLVGTFLVRSGVLTSVHAFAIDPRARHVHPAAAAGGDRRLADAVCDPRAGAEGRRAVRADLARGRAGAEQSAAHLRLRHGVPRHAVSAVPRRGGRAEALGRVPVLQPHLRAADGAADRWRSASARCCRGSAATCWARCSGCGPRSPPSWRCWRPGTSPTAARDLRGAGLRPRRLDRRRGDRRMGRAGPAVPRRLRRQPAPRDPPAARRLWHDASRISAWRCRSPASPPRPSTVELIAHGARRRRPAESGGLRAALRWAWSSVPGPNFTANRATVEIRRGGAA